MRDPITTIDLANSGSPDAVATPWEQTRRVLETAEVFWLATVRADGRPHVTPVSPAWLDGTPYFSIGDMGQKAKNLRGNAHVALTTGCNRLLRGSTSWSKVMLPQLPTQPCTSASIRPGPVSGAMTILSSYTMGSYANRAGNQFWCSRSRPPRSSPTPGVTSGAKPATSSDTAPNLRTRSRGWGGFTGTERKAVQKRTRGTT